jgi:PhoPQ-activated pathogenicity-related protein
VRALDRPSEVKLWQATNPKARDFRLAVIGRAWTSSTLTGDEGVYVAAPPKPADGWSAFFVELTFERGEAQPSVFTTEVVVTPDVYPFDPPAGAR